MFLVALAVGVAWTREDAAPSVRVLGSGVRLSLLVTSGESRLLIASGDDASAFANALSAALNPTSRRIDVVILAGDERDLAVASRVVRDYGDRRMFVLDGPLAAHLSDLGLKSEDVIAGPTQFRLSNGTDIVLRPSPARDGQWSAEVHRDGLIVRTASSVANLDSNAFAEATIITGDLDLDGLDGLETSALAVPADTPWSELFDALKPSEDRRLWAVRVPEGASTQITFTEAGLSLPSEVRSVQPGRA
jgi:hypothetical protein